jgi:hypothetical protein
MMSLNHNPPNLSLPSAQDYRCEPLTLAWFWLVFLLFVFYKLLNKTDYSHINFYCILKIISFSLSFIFPTYLFSF